MQSLCVASVLIMASLAQASPSYVYATGDKLKLQLKPEGFIGIKDIFTLSQGGSPLDFSTVKLSQASPPRKKFVMASVQSTEDYDAAFSSSAEAQGSYEGISASASAKYTQSQTFTSTSSLYMMFFETQLGDVYINSDAKLTKNAEKLLVSDPKRFVEVYGLYYIYGATIGCQASSTVTLTAQSEQDKKTLDVAAKASYQSMFSASADFTGKMESQKGFKGLSVNVFTHGGNVPAVASSIDEVRTKILDPLDTGGACSTENAVVSRALVRSWLSLQAIDDLAQNNTNIIEAMSPNHTILPNTLDRMNNVIMKSKTLLKKAEKCHHNVFSCVTKQWNESTTARDAYYTSATENLTIFQSKIDKITQATLNSDTVLQFEKELDDIYQTWLKPAEALTSFTFTFKIRVLNWYDDYADPPPYGTNGLTGSFTINPNYQDTINQAIEWATKPQIDNGHSNCRHFYGNFYASYQADTLTVWQVWNRVCGSYNQKTSTVIFQPGGDNEGTTDYDDTVRTIYSFSVTYAAKASHDSIIAMHGMDGSCSAS